MYRLISSCALVATTACTTSDKLLPCPAAGIAAAHLASYVPPKPDSGNPSWGTIWPDPAPDALCTDQDGCTQIQAFKQYACAVPQICPDVGGPEALFVRSVGATAGTDVHVLITNCSTGDRPLHISKVVILGDDRCAFTDPSIGGDSTVAPGSTTAIRTTYKPPTFGNDHAELRIHSDAQNAPELHVLMCGSSVPFGDAGPTDRQTVDGGSSADAREAPLRGSLQCRPRNELAPCRTK